MRPQVYSCMQKRNCHRSQTRQARDARFSTSCPNQQFPGLKCYNVTSSSIFANFVLLLFNIYLHNLFIYLLFYLLFYLFIYLFILYLFIILFYFIFIFFIYFIYFGTGDSQPARGGPGNVSDVIGSSQCFSHCHCDPGAR